MTLTRLKKNTLSLDFIKIEILSLCYLRKEKDINKPFSLGNSNKYADSA